MLVLLYGYPIHLFEGVSRHEPDGIPGEFGTDPCADHTAGTFIKANLHWWNGKSIFLLGYRFDAVHRAKWDTGLTACTIILIHHRHNFGASFLNPRIVR